MPDVVLVAPQIATNTGNIVRLCANVGAGLHLVRPLGFALDDAALRRGGLDYHELIDTHVWDTWAECRAALGSKRRWFATTTRAPNCRYDEVRFAVDDVLVFGCESAGLDDSLLAGFPTERRLSIPMRPSNRSARTTSTAPPSGRSRSRCERRRPSDFTPSAAAPPERCGPRCGPGRPRPGRRRRRRRPPSRRSSPRESTRR